MQTAGNKLREQFGGNYLAEKAVEIIVTFRRSNGGYSDDNVLLAGRRAYIIDSIKNEEELELLRQIYRETLCVIGVFAPDDIRRNRLIDSGTPESQVQNILDRDEHEVHTFGQRTRKVFVESDFFVCNDETVDELRQKLERYFDLIFDVAVRTPTRAESAMYEASSASANSACLSRQVGAAIVSKTNELIAVGWNDVPRFGGGLYLEDDHKVYDSSVNKIIDRDHRCFNWDGKICHNEMRRAGILDTLAGYISSSTLLKDGTTVEDVKSQLRRTDIDSIVEFSRSIHAEMEAILSVAREGRHSLVGATLYTTTYPCHNCARHIVAAGITSVIYIEPYQKSLATKLHSDSVTENPNEQSKVVFRQYGGVAPKNFLRLFRPEAPRKLGGRLAIKEPKSAVPVFRIPLDEFALYESKVIAELFTKEHTPATGIAT